MADQKIDLSNFIAFAQAESDEFLRLDWTEIGKFLFEENLVVKTEKEAFEALQRWVMHSPTERLSKVPQLLPLIRLNQLDADHLAANVKDFAAKAKCVSLIVSAIQRQSLRMDKRDKFRVKFLTKPRQSATEVVICAFVTKSVAKYSTKSKKWMTEEIADTSIYSSIPARCMYGKYEMIIHDGEDFMLLNLITLETKELPPLPNQIQLEGFTAHVVKDNLFVIGYSDSSDTECYLCSQSSEFEVTQNEMFKYNFASGKWSHVHMLFEEPVTYTAVGHFSAVLDGKIYIASGRIASVWSMGHPCAELECYDPAEDAWWSLEPMCPFRTNAEMVAFKQYLYVFGGLDKNGNVLATIERYDSIENEWCIIAKMKDYVYGFGVISVLDRVYLLGGECIKHPNNPWLKVPYEVDRNKSYAVFDLNTETVSSHHQKIRKMPRNAIWPSVGYYVNE